MWRTCAALRAGAALVRSAPGWPGAFLRGRDMAAPCQFKVGDPVARRGPNGIPDPLMSGVIEEVKFLGPSGGGAEDCFYLVRHPNGQLFAAWENELARLEGRT